MKIRLARALAIVLLLGLALVLPAAAAPATSAAAQGATGVAETYSASGRVTGATGNGMPGVKVSAGSGHTATTDNNGYYTISGLDAGVYFLSASSTGQSFLPQTRIIQVPPNATGQDFSLKSPTGLTLNYTTGKPGSTFRVTGVSWPANSTLSVAVDNQVLGTVRTSSDGSLEFELTTSHAVEGEYLVTVADNATAGVKFTLGPNYPLRQQEGGGPIFDVPGALRMQYLYLPAVAKEQ